jgi:hypothetical protein
MRQEHEFSLDVKGGGNAKRRCDAKTTELRLRPHRQTVPPTEIPPSGNQSTAPTLAVGLVMWSAFALLCFRFGSRFCGSTASGNKVLVMGLYFRPVPCPIPYLCGNKVWTEFPWGANPIKYMIGCNICISVITASAAQSQAGHVCTNSLRLHRRWGSYSFSQKTSWRGRLW